MRQLAPYASHSEQSIGRLYAPDKSPTRSEFQRDRDRIIHSTAFRRLQHKTQVFLQHEGHHFRTRLTHTLEVSQIARSLARALHLNEDLAEAVALAHDLGHTPFGHAGERVLNAKMSAIGGFDHNMQALRVVTMLENRYAEHDGLNLTWESLEGILKHNGPLTGADGQAIGKYVEEGLPPGISSLPAPADLRVDTYPSLEAQVAAVADDIAYNAHDIDDAIRAGLLTVGDLVHVPLVGPIVEEVMERWPKISANRQTHEIQRRLITRSVENVIHTSRAKIAAHKPLSADAVRLCGVPLVTISDEFMAAQSGLKKFLFANVYRAEEVMVHVRRSETVLSELFDHFNGGSTLPGEWATAFDTAADEGSKIRVVGDFIAGMTDPYALDLYECLFDARPDFS